MSTSLRIGAVAREAGVSVDAIRFYERERLLPAAERTAAGYRVYVASVVQRLRFIDRSKALGFSLAEIRDLLSLGDHRDQDMASLRAQIAAKVGVVTEKIDELERIRGALERLHRQCPGQGPLDLCPILAALEIDDAPASTRRQTVRHRAAVRIPKPVTSTGRPSNARSRT